MLALVFTFHREPLGPETPQQRSFTSRQPADRLAFVPRGTLSDHAPILNLRPSLAPGAEAAQDLDGAGPGGSVAGSVAEEAETATAADEGADVATWSTETHQAAPQQPASRFSLLPSLRLPWQSARPAAPQRTYTLKTRLEEIGPTARLRLAAKFEAAKAAWPPAEIALVAIKDERALELHARAAGGAWTLIHRYRVLAASGGAGPKLRQGDRQVPEGIYRIALLNPNSAYHVSLRVNYPNAFDRQMAAKDGRSDLGGDIMIHGKNLSAGCLAMGDEAAEELFVAAAGVGLSKVRVIIAPTDLRSHAAPELAAGRPAWVPGLYGEIATAMAEFKPPPSKGLLSFFMK